MSGVSAPSAAHIRWRPIGILTALAVLAALTLLHPSATRIHTWPWRGVAWLFWLAPAVILLGQWSLGRPWHGPAPLLTTGLVMLAGATVASAAVSPFAPLSLPHVWPTLGAISWIFVLHDALARQPERRALLVQGLAVGAAVLVAASLTLWWLQAAPPHWSHRNDFPFGHSTLTAGTLVLVLPWLAHAALRFARTGVARVDRITSRPPACPFDRLRIPNASRDRPSGAAGTLGPDGRQKSATGTTEPASARVACMFWFVATAAALVALASTGSRGGLLAAGAVGVAAGAVTLIRARLSRGRKLLLVALGILVGVLGVASNHRLRDVALGRGWSEIARESNRQRTAMLEAGARLGAARPLLGWGPGTVPLTYPLMRARLPGGVDNVLQLHNSAAQLWATLGGAGGLAGLVTIAGLVVGAWRRFRHGDWDATDWTAVASLGGYAVFALTDHQLDVPFIHAVVAANVALLARSRAARPVPRGWPLAIIALLAVVVVPTVRDLLARRAYAGGDAETASAWMPMDAYYRHQQANHLLTQAGAADAARELLKSSLRSGVHTEYAHFNLGWLLLGDSSARAAEHFRAAAQLAPTRGGVYFGLALAYQSGGRDAEAGRCFALEALNDPLAITAPVWETPAFAPVRPRVLDEIARLARTEPVFAERAAWIRWWAGSDEVPAPALSSFSASSRAFLAALPQMTARQPLDLLPYRWAQLYEVWRMRGDAERWKAITHDAELTAALERRAARHSENFLGFLRAGTEDDWALVKTWPRVRTGYGVLAFHPDGAPPADLYMVQVNRLLADIVPDLFPPKGALPARHLLALLPENP